MQIDEQLLQKCIAHDRKAQSELYRLSFGLLLSIAYRYYSNKNDAMAALNQCFFKVLTGLENFKQKNSVQKYKPWISRIMINTIIDEYRASKKHHTMHREEMNESQMDLNQADYNQIEETIEAEELQVMLNALPILQRNVFNLFVIDGYSHREIAESLSITVGNSKWNLSTARSKLKTMIRSVINKNVIPYDEQ